MAAPNLEALFSVNPDYYRSAVVELKRALPVAKITRVGPDAGVVALRGMSLAELAKACATGRLRFIRHLAEVLTMAPTSSLRRSTPEEIGETLAKVLRAAGAPVGNLASVHVWESGEVGISPTAVRRPIVADLTADGVEVKPSGCPQTVSICLGTEQVVVAANDTKLGLTDWPGGRLRLAAGKDQISRAEFKLEELFHHYDLDVSGVALDLGAAPGGWTRILLAQGASLVHAVDPAELDPRLAADRRVVHHATTAGEFLRETDEEFDLVVNDMRMDQLRSVHLVLHAAQHLRPGGMAIMTLKLRGGDAVADVDEAVDLLSQQFAIRFVRQLQHNRHEVTVVARLRDERQQRWMAAQQRKAERSAR